MNSETPNPRLLTEPVEHPCYVIPQTITVRVNERLELKNRKRKKKREDEEETEKLLLS